jgi:hypothetical protein
VTVPVAITPPREPNNDSPVDTVAAEVECMLAMGKEIREHMTPPVSSDRSDLYDVNGLPLCGGDFSQTDIEPALKA